MQEGCLSNVCPCKKHNLRCTEACKCIECRNQDEGDDINSDSDDISDDADDEL